MIDRKTMKVEKTFPVPLDVCTRPQGMAIGPHNQILLGCNGPSPSGHRNIVDHQWEQRGGPGGAPGPGRRRRSLV